jgi:c-di-GMP-binding flagellar brake protein YcgR
MAAAIDEILADAVSRNSAAVLSLPSAGMLRHHKSRFLAQTAEGIWIESAPEDRPLINALLAEQASVGISFKSPPNKANFSTTIVRQEPSYQLNATATVEALLVRSPEKVNAVQRRSNYRVRVSESCELSAKAWKISDHVPVRDRPQASNQLQFEVRDLSVGGMGISLHRARDNRMPAAGQRLRIELKWKDIELILDGALRYPGGDPEAEVVRAGVQFKKLENDLGGRQSLAALTRIVGEFQREEVRRARLGL